MNPSGSWHPWISFAHREYKVILPPPYKQVDAAWTKFMVFRGFEISLAKESA